MSAPRPHRVLYWSLSGHSAHLAKAIAERLGCRADAACVPGYRGALGKLRMAVDFPTHRVPEVRTPGPDWLDAASVTLCGPVWGGRPAPVLRALLRLDGLPEIVGFALTCQHERMSGGAIRHAEVVLGRPFHATLLLESRQEGSALEAERSATFAAVLAG